MVLLASGGPASAEESYITTGEIGWLQTGPGFVWFRLHGDLTLCKNGGTGLFKPTQIATVFRTSVGSQVVNEEDLNRILAVAQLAFTTRQVVDVSTYDSPSGCKVKALALRQ